jgi:carbonic anhydrase
MSEHLSNVIQANHEWASKQDAEFFSKLASGQSPKVLYIGCADSRVPPTFVLNQRPGDLFVHRNIANVVVHSDLSCLSVLQYAVQVLKVEYVIVCGHTHCGGVRAAMGDHSYGLIDNWLRPIKDIIVEHSAELDALADAQARETRCIELNAIHSMRNLAHTDIVQSAWKRGQKLALRAWVYDIATGKARDVGENIDGPDDVNKVYLFGK